MRNLKFMKFANPIKQIIPYDSRLCFTKLSFVVVHVLIQIHGVLQILCHDIITRFCFEEIYNGDDLLNLIWLLKGHDFSFIFREGFVWCFNFEFIYFFYSVPFLILFLLWSCFVNSSPCPNTKDIIDFVNEISCDFYFWVWTVFHLNMKIRFL